MKKEIKKPIEENPIVENILPSPLDNLMGDCYSIYAKDVIQNRAIPDVRDGLKPVQRRIIFSMAISNHVISKPTVKCAHIVGDVMGKLHPHGDSSIYEALVRMSQNWKVNVPLIDFQGNNGSIDGDGPAAYRYTEARLSEAANEMVRDLNKNTVDMTLNFDDTMNEPIVLPSRFPNLFVNGTSGIAVALATDIPPHNLKEMCDAAVYRIEHPTCTIQDLRQIVLGPDFPTGGIIYESEGLDNTYLTGRGKIEVLSKTEIVDTENGKEIVITEIPYGINKKDLVFEIEKVQNSGEIDGINEVRDETEMDGVRIVVSLKPGIDANLILQYLKKNTPLLSNYSPNIVAICGGRPKTLNLIDYLDAYIEYQQELITRRCEYDLKVDTDRVHILEGLIKMVSIVDKVIATIRRSTDKGDAKVNLCNEFGFSIEQAEAIVTLQLYKFSNTDITKFLNEKDELEKEIEELNSILGSKRKLNNVIIKDLENISKKFGTPRKTQIIQKEEEIVIDKRSLILNEEVYIAVTRDGYIKRSTLKSYKSSNSIIPGIKSDDQLICADTAHTIDYLLCFTDKANFLFLPIHEIQEGKWKDEAKHINYLCNLPVNEHIIKAIVIEDFNEDAYVASITGNGQLKRTSLKEFFVTRYSKPVAMMRLSPNDYLADVCLTNGDSDLFILNSEGKATLFNENEIAPLAIRTAGVKSLNHNNGKIVCMYAFAKDDKKRYSVILTNHGHERIFDISTLDVTERLARPYIIMKSFKSDPHDIISCTLLDKTLDTNTLYVLNTNKETKAIVIDDYHMTPIEKYAKYNIDSVKESDILVSVYNFKVLHWFKTNKTYKVTKVINPTTPLNENIGDENKKEKDHEQISMFDLNDD